MRSIQAADFKSRCLTLLDKVARTGEGITVTKDGKAVARLIPARKVKGKGKYSQDSLARAFKIIGDVVGPVLPAQAWEAETGK